MLHVSKMVACLVASSLLTAAAVEAGPIAGEPREHNLSPYMRVYGPTLPPYGYIRFCRAFPQECRAGPLEEARVEMTSERKAQLEKINLHANHTISPATDLEIYGEVERWTLPVTRGDCEDYALLKRHLLMRRGWPASALLMTVVRDEKGEGHAVLTARTSAGDFILDNKTDKMRPWYQTPYRYVMRQSYIDPNVWLSLAPMEQPMPSSLSGTRDGP